MPSCLRSSALRGEADASTTLVEEENEVRRASRIISFLCGVFCLFRFGFGQFESKIDCVSNVATCWYENEKQRHSGRVLLTREEGNECRHRSGVVEKMYCRTSSLSHFIFFSLFEEEALPLFRFPKAGAAAAPPLPPALMEDDANGAAAEAAAVAAPAAPSAPESVPNDGGNAASIVVEAPPQPAPTAPAPVAAPPPPPSLPDWLGPLTATYITDEAIESLRAGGETTVGQKNQSTSIADDEKKTLDLDLLFFSPSSTSLPMPPPHTQPIQPPTDAASASSFAYELVWAVAREKLAAAKPPPPKKRRSLIGAVAPSSSSATPAATVAADAEAAEAAAAASVVTALDVIKAAGLLGGATPTAGAGGGDDEAMPDAEAEAATEEGKEKEKGKQVSPPPRWLSQALADALWLAWQELGEAEAAAAAAAKEKATTEGAPPPSTTTDPSPPQAARLRVAALARSLMMTPAGDDASSSSPSSSPSSPPLLKADLMRSGDGDLLAASLALPLRGGGGAPSAAALAAPPAAAAVAAAADALRKREVRLNTRALYTQHKFNLMREEAEGYSKLLALLHGVFGEAVAMMMGSSCSSNPSTSSAPPSSSSTFSAVVSAAAEDLASLIGVFDLDPNRVADAIIEAAQEGAFVASASSSIINNAPSAAVSFIVARGPIDDALRTLLAPFAKGTVTQVLGARCQRAAAAVAGAFPPAEGGAQGGGDDAGAAAASPKPAASSPPPPPSDAALWPVAAALLCSKIIALEELLPHLTPSAEGEELSKAAEAGKAAATAAAVAVGKISLTSKATTTTAEGTSNALSGLDAAAAGAYAAGLSAAGLELDARSLAALPAGGPAGAASNQLLLLLEALLHCEEEQGRSAAAAAAAADDDDDSNNNSKRKNATALYSLLVSKGLDPASSPGVAAALAASALASLEKAMATAMAKKESGETSPSSSDPPVPHPLSLLLLSSSSQTLSDFPDRALEDMLALGQHAFVSPSLLSLACTAWRSVVESNLKKLEKGDDEKKKKKNNNGDDAADEATTAARSALSRAEHLFTSVIFPATSLLPGSAAAASLAWSCLELLPYEQRYRLYSAHRDVSNSSPLLSAASKMAVVAARKVMRRLHAPARALSSAAQRERAAAQAPFARMLAKASHSAPLAVASAVAAQAEAYPNMTDPCVEALKYCSPLTMDALGFVLLDRLASSRRAKLKEDGVNIADWLASLAAFAGCLCRRWPERVAARPLLQYSANALKECDPYDLLVLKELLTSMGGVPTVADLSEGQVEALAGGSVLRELALNVGGGDSGGGGGGGGAGGAGAPGSSASGATLLAAEKAKARVAARLAAALSEGKRGEGGAVAVADASTNDADGDADDSLTLPLLLLLAQQRKAVAATTSSPHIKLIAELYDKTHETCLQYGEFLGRALSPRALAAALAPAPLGKMGSAFGVDAPVAFDAWRSLLPLVSPSAVEAAVARAGDAAERAEEEAKARKEKEAAAAEEEKKEKAATAAASEEGEEGEAPMEAAADAPAADGSKEEEGEEGELEDAKEEGEATFTPAGPAALAEEAKAKAEVAVASVSARAAAEAKARELLSPLLLPSSSATSSSTNSTTTNHLVPYSTLISEVEAMEPASTWKALTPQLFSAFWRLRLSDLVVPEEAYQSERRRAVAEGAQRQRQLADLERDKAAKERALANWRGGVGGGGGAAGAWGMPYQQQMQMQQQQVVTTPEELRAMDEDARALRLDISRAADAVVRLDEEVAQRRRHVAAVMAAVEAEALALDFSSDPSGEVVALSNSSSSSSTKRPIGWLANVKAAATVETFVERCALPRLLHSPGDAAYVAAFVEVLLQQRLRLPGFSTLLYYDRVMKEVVGGALLCATDREAGNLGVFLRHTLRALER